LWRCELDLTGAKEGLALSFSNVLFLVSLEAVKVMPEPVKKLVSRRTKCSTLVMTSVAM
jgi:hypothetical protein